MRISDWSSDVCSSDLARSSAIKLAASSSDRSSGPTREVAGSGYCASACSSSVGGSSSGAWAFSKLERATAESVRESDTAAIRASTDFPQIGRAHVRTPATNAHLVGGLRLEKKNK